MQTTENKLKTHTLRVTPIRLEVLDFFTAHKGALSHADLEAHFSQKFDRVTIYRTLTAFLDKGILHRVSDDTGVAKYALCHHEGTEHNHDDNHVHFKCQVCGTIECLHTLEIPAFKLPKKYRMAQANLLIEGVCPICNN
jgi:Fur family ferric uptake transcriptional regulator